MSIAFKDFNINKNVNFTTEFSVLINHLVFNSTKSSETPTYDAILQEIAIKNLPESRVTPGESQRPG